MNELEIVETILYQGPNGAVFAEVYVGEETIWTTQKGMSKLFEVKTNTINEHLKNIFNSQELNEISTIRNFRIVQNEGNRQVKRNVNLYNLDAIIAVGYRVNTKKATYFRQWATQILKEYMIKGFVLNDESLKNGGVLGKDYFDELLERIREIRASERRFYQKVTDIFAECSYDYDKNSVTAKEFYAKVQNKLHFAITGQTAAEIIISRADHEKEFMGLKTWSNAPHGKVIKKDTSVAKNYLNENELSELNTLVSMYLDYAELQAKRHNLMYMEDWAEKLDSFLEFNEYGVLVGKGKVSMDSDKKIASEEYDLYRPIQDKLFKSDFDNLLEEINDIEK